MQLAFICSGAYVALPPNTVDLLAAGTPGDEASFHAVLVVPASSTAATLSDLRGKRFAFTDPLSLTGKIYPDYRLAELGTDAESFFARTFFTASHERALDAVVAGLADGAFVSDVVYYKLVALPSNYWNRLRVIETSRPFPPPPVVAPLTVSKSDRELLRGVLLTMADTKGGAELLAQIGLRRFVAIEPQTYDVVRRMTETTTARAR